jgi:hypothetical protein
VILASLVLSVATLGESGIAKRQAKGNVWDLEIYIERH